MKTALKQLEMKGFRSFVSPTSIVFPDSGLVLLMGPSGSGKSSVFLAIAHALGYCPFPASELQSWQSDSKMEVSLRLGTEEGEVTIQRGTRSLVSGAVNVQGASNINPTIQKLTGINQELLAALTYRPQKTPGLFLSKTNSEMQEFLSILLGLNRFDEAIESVQEQIKAVSTKVAAQELTLPKLEEAYRIANEVQLGKTHDVADFEKQIQSARQVYTLTDDNWLAAKDAREKAQQEWSAKNLEFDKAKALLRLEQPVVGNIAVDDDPEVISAGDFLKQIELRLTRLMENDKKNETEYEAKRKEANETLRAALVAEQKEKTLLKEAASLVLEIEKLKTSTCPKCEQTWITDKAAEALTKAQASLLSINEEIEELSPLVDELKASRERVGKLLEPFAHDPRIKQMEELYDEAQQKLTRATIKAREVYLKEVHAQQEKMLEKLGRISEQQAQLAKVAMAEIEALTKHENALGAEREKAQAAFNEATMRLNQVKTENAAIERDNARIVLEKENRTKEVLEARANYAALTKEMKELQDLLELLKGFLSAIFDEVLEEIAWNTNQMLAMVPNVAHITLKFKSETTTQKGTTKRGLIPVVTIAGDERPLRSALSGGMASAVELAVDLAVRKVISARSGAIPNWLVLDECFEGLGVAEKEACLDILKQAASDTLILVIDHTSETKELFSQVIEVENVNGRSKIISS